ncbi:hypothetical protein E3Q06_03062 [Wallemia mellicola]|uniref:DDT domain-containing protein n=1 Tax=Wallemia mellicola TaxID=1708541 RepID=A0AB38MU27_9BASI|nr:hypothetical protein E3Q21_03076 [Wallemia mellicola]TIB85826.1 hypothetical protein E3Q20_03067 [Wallemia mellicola]TIC39366.1 hypothetical protein E3Q07_03084 [Wallemia mellicola]TIC47551.1 hypothetical protein E3Q06_03062 [Wallemia mellicola]TIC63336.1 hypothetical protein E3Q02_03078 [Wallemia mellicola]
MPTVKRRPVERIPNPILEDTQAEVFYIDATAEIFLDYTLVPFYICPYVDTYCIPYACTPLKPHSTDALLEVMGRLDSLIDLIFDRFKSRFWPGESVFVDLQGQKFFARIVNVYPPKEIVEHIQSHREPDAKRVKTDNDAPEEDVNGVRISELHRMGVDLEIPQAEADAADPPLSYYYTVQLAGQDDKFSGSYMELKAASLSRDRLMFSKTILRKFLRDSLTRSTAVGAPWRVKPNIAKLYDIPEELTIDMKARNDEIRKSKLDERKKVVIIEPKIEPPTMIPTEVKPRQRTKPKAIKKEVQKVVAAVKEKEKKKSTKYPCEDLDIVLTTREINARSKENSLLRPIPSQPMEGSHQTFDNVLQAWSFLNTFEIPLHLSTFTLDDFISVLQLQTNEKGVPQLLTEIHVCLINMLIRERDHIEGMTEIPLNEAAMEDATWVLETVDRYGNSWTRKLISEPSERHTLWLRATIGCLRSHLTNETHNQWRKIYAHLFATGRKEQKSKEAEGVAKEEGSTSSLSELEDDADKPEDRYFSLSIDDKLLFILSLIERVKMTRHIRNFVDKAEPHLTELRKEKVDLNREKKKLTEKTDEKAGGTVQQSAPSALSAPSAPEAPSEPMQSVQPASELASENIADNNSEALSEPPEAAEEDEEEDEEEDQLASESGSEKNETESVNTKSSKFEKHEPEPEPVQLTPEEEAIRLSNRVEAIDNEFRATNGTLRWRPLGEDRFFNTYWFIDGLGSCPLQGTAAAPGEGYEAGRLFVHRPHLPDPAVMQASHDIISRLIEDRESDLIKDERLFEQIERDLTAKLADKRKAEEGESGMLQPGEWGAYDNIDDIKSLMNWCQQKGNRELALRNSIQRWLPWLEKSINHRKAELKATNDKMEVDGQDMKPSYMTWKNKRIN